MSEIAGAGTINPPGKAKVGTVGPAMPGFEMTPACSPGQAYARAICAACAT